MRQEPPEAHQAWQASLSSPAPVTSLWLVLHDPDAFRRIALARWMTARRARAKLIRPLWSPGNGATLVNRIEPVQVHHARLHPARKRDRERAAPFLSHGHPASAPIKADHHDFASRFRDR
jgi:hypothetical protein